MIEALRLALTVTPDNLPLRQHLAELLFKAGDFAEAEKEYRFILAQTPQDEVIKLALAETFCQQAKWMMALVILEELIKGGKSSARVYELAAQAYRETGQTKQAETAQQQVQPTPPPPAATTVTPPDDSIRVPLEDFLGEVAPEVERSKTAFQDVGGMEKLKEEIRLKIIHPINHPEIYKAYGKTIGGGILMYGPPGCGKTHLARATAGEVNASFISMGIHDVLHMYLGESERNLHSFFQMARRNRPCVLFIDEVDALGANRTDMRQSAGRHLINQLLSEMDGIDMVNDGLLILAATNAPWHLDPALRRPGRFDRMIFVPPPDMQARAAILKVILREKPTEQIDYEQLARRTDGFSGADLKGLVDVAIEQKLQEAIRKGVPQPLTTHDLIHATATVKPSTKEWFATARNYALYANESGAYDEITEYLKNEGGEAGLFSRMSFWKGNK